MVVDLSKLPANLEPDFTLWRTGQGDAGEWTLVADPTAAGGRAIAQVSKDRTDYRFPLAVYKPPITASRSRSTNPTPVKTSRSRCASNP